MIGALVCDVAEMRDGKEIGIAPTSPPLAKLLCEPELIASSIARCLGIDDEFAIAELGRNTVAGATAGATNYAAVSESQ